MVNTEGSLVLVTGAGSGIGRATALAFAARGATVLCVDLEGGESKRTARSCGEVGAPAHGFTCDVADWDAVVGLAERVNAQHGVLDVLVNNAGVGLTGHFADESIGDWRWIRSINLDGVVHGCKAFSPPMLERGAGHVVNVSSGFAYAVRATEASYVTTKAAVLALSRCLRADWHGNGIGVSAICPGVVNTQIVERTRYLAERGNAAFKARIARFYAKAHPPQLVAEAIVAAVDHNRAVVPVGLESRLAWYARRLLPTSLEQYLGRLDIP